jgi:hypothetical protein
MAQDILHFPHILGTACSVAPECDSYWLLFICRYSRCHFNNTEEHIFLPKVLFYSSS